jgi:hypothetical protein
VQFNVIADAAAEGTGGILDNGKCHIVVSAEFDGTSSSDMLEHKNQKANRRCRLAFLPTWRKSCVIRWRHATPV